MDKVTGQCPQTTTFLKRKESPSGIEQRGPSAYQPNALPLGRAKPDLAALSSRSGISAISTAARRHQTES